MHEDGEEQSDRMLEGNAYLGFHNLYFSIYYSDDLIKGDEMDMTCRTHLRAQKFSTNFWLEGQNGRDPLG